MTKTEQFLIGDQKLKESFNVLEEVLSDKEHVVVAYSGGKDSTALALLLFQWIVEKKKKIDVVLLHSDTLSEVPKMEDWTRTFAKRYVEMLSKNGSSGILKIVRPEPWETFYWRVLVRGYPAPTFKWRWCVDLLKRRPSKRFLKNRKRNSDVAWPPRL
jgi:DNA sulfur modification protein DndC